MAPTIRIAEDGIYIPEADLGPLDYTVELEGKPPRTAINLIFADPIDLIPHGSIYSFQISARRGVNRGAFYVLATSGLSLDDLRRAAQMNRFMFTARDGKRFTFERIDGVTC